MVKTLSFHCRGHRFDLEELRSPKPYSVTKKVTEPVFTFINSVQGFPFLHILANSY